ERKNHRPNHPKHQSKQAYRSEFLKGAFCTFFHSLEWISKITFFRQKHFSFFRSEKNQAKTKLLSANRNLRFTVLRSIIPINQFFYSYEIQKNLFGKSYLSYLLF